MSIAVAKVNLDTLPSAEAAAIRAAEAEASEFYGDIEAEEFERARLAELKKLCGLIWNNRYSAVDVLTKELSTDDFFTATEKATILKVAGNLHPDAEHRPAMKAHDFIQAVARLHRTMTTGYYFENSPATELLARHAA